jgi:hypothetical protein
MEVSPGSWNVNGSGYDIWGTSDSFHFYNFERNTDVTVTAFIESWETEHDWAKGGIMIRDSLDANASHALLASTGHELVTMMWRASTADITRNANAQIGTKRVWLRMVKEGTRFTSYMKLENQVDWEKFYERDVYFTEGPFYVGIAACSHRQGYPASLTVRSFEILDKVWVPTPPPHLDIGKPTLAGDAMETAPGNWTVMAAGSDIWGWNDQFHFVQFNRTEDVTVTCFVESFATQYDWAKGGLMIRDTLDPNSAHAMVVQTGHSFGRVAMQTRPTVGASSNGMYKSLYTNTKRVWLRIVKEGNKINGYYKNEGELVYQKLHTYEVEFTRDWYYVGIAVTSHLQNTLSTLEVSHFDISDEIYTLPARDIGNTGREILANKLTSDTWSIQGSGYDIGGTADSFAFNNYKQSGENLTATVHLDVLKKFSPDSKGGIMLRSTHEVDSPHVSLLASKTGITMLYRTSVGGGTSKKNVGVWSEHMDLKLEKNGNTVACLYKHESFPDWFYLDSVDIDVGSEYYVGHAVTSAGYGREATLIAGNIHINDEAIAV